VRRAAWLSSRPSIHNRERILLERVDPICLLLSHPLTSTLALAFLSYPTIRLSI